MKIRYHLAALLLLGLHSLEAAAAVVSREEMVQRAREYLDMELSTNEQMDPLCLHLNLDRSEYDVLICFPYPLWKCLDSKHVADNQASDGVLSAVLEPGGGARLVWSIQRARDVFWYEFQFRSPAETIWRTSWEGDAESEFTWNEGHPTWGRTVLRGCGGHLHPVFRLGLDDSLTEEDRRRLRSKGFAVTCAIARTDEELPPFKRALKISYGRFTHLAAHGPRDMESDEIRFLKLDETPPFMGPDEVHDPLNIHNALSSVEETALNHEGG